MVTRALRTIRSRWLKLLGAIACLIIAHQSAYGQTSESLAERVQVLEAQEEIRALILAYGEAHDGRDYRSFSELFAEDGEWVGGLGSAKGPRAIFELMDSTIGHDPQPEGSGTYHVMTNDQIAIDGDRASATTKWIYLTPGDDGGPNMVFPKVYRARNGGDGNTMVVSQAPESSTFDQLVIGVGRPTRGRPNIGKSSVTRDQALPRSIASRDAASLPASSLAKVNIGSVRMRPSFF